MAEPLLPPLVVTRKTGCERFRIGSTFLAFDLLSFWQWSASDLVSNALRGRLAEFLVAQALGIANGLRAEWDAFDLQTATGVKIEVKSAAYLQTWAQKALSAITFDIAPTRFWDASTNELAIDKLRHAHVYVFALLAHQDKSTLDAMDLSQWHFYVIDTATLNTSVPGQRTLSLATLLKLNPAFCGFAQLKATIESIATNSKRKTPEADPHAAHK